MRSLCFNEQKYIIRPEFFGGLLINKETMEKYALSRYDSIFLQSIKENNAIDSILDYICKHNHINFHPNYEFYLKSRVLIKGDIAENPRMNIEEVSFQQGLLENTSYLSCPIEIAIYPTLNCNMSCPYCFANSGGTQHKDYMNYHEWVNLSKEFVQHGVCAISILGGEPSVYPEIVPLIHELNKLGVKISITSNGKKWSEQLIKEVINSKNLVPIFSVDTSSLSKNEKSLGLSGELIDYLNSKGKLCRINSVYTGQKEEDVLRIVDFCCTHNIIKYSIALCFGKEQTLPSINDVLKIGKVAKQYKKINYPDSRCIISTEGCMLFSGSKLLNGNSVRTEFQKILYGCECGNTKLDILSNGDAYGCAAYIGMGHKLGNVFNDSWEKIWNESIEMQRVRNMRTEDSFCKKCDCFHFCKGGCPAIIDLQKETSYSYDKRCERHKRNKCLN